MSEEKHCTCWNDPCDPEECGGTVQEFIDGGCQKTLFRDMQGDTDWREWLEYVYDWKQKKGEVKEDGR